MLKKLLLKKRRIDNEDGFTLVEIMIGILIIGILTAIAVPMFINAQNEINSQPIRADLKSAGIIIGQEAIDNNGLFPKYVPNEMKNHPVMKGMVYSYSDSRTSWCLQAFSTVGKLFLSSDNPGEIISTPCTKDNIAEGTTLPWQNPTITTPPIPTATNLWESNKTSSESTINIGVSTCTLAPQDAAEWDSKKVIQYRAVVKNVEPINSIDTSGNFNGEFTTEWSTSRVQKIHLPGWFPAENVEYTAQARCLISNGLDYPYESLVSGKKTGGVVATFIVVATPFTLFTTVWDAQDKFSANAAWTGTDFCPAGDKKSLLSIKDSQTGATFSGSTTWKDWRTAANQTVASWSSGGTTTATHTASCVLSPTKRISSTPTTIQSTNPLRPPVAPTGLVTKTVITASTLTTPTSLEWNAVTCVGDATPQYQVTRTAPGTGSASWTTNRSHAITTVAGTSYTYQVAARCVDGANTSISSLPSTPITFVGQYVAPAAPLTPTGLTLSVAATSTSLSGHTLKWTAVSCNNGAVAHYEVRQTIKNGSALTTPTTFAWQQSTTYSITTTSLQHGSTVAFNVTAKCVNNGGEKTGLTSAAKAGTLGIPKPNIVSLTNNGQSSVSWSGAECSPGTTLQYRSTQTKYGSTAGAWAIRSWGASTVGTTPQYFQGHPLTATAEPRCVGTDLTVQGDTKTTDWTSPIGVQPNAIAVSGGSYANYTLYWSGGWGCTAGTSNSGWTFRSDAWPVISGWHNVVKTFGINTTNTQRPIFPDGTYYWFSVEQQCYTSWVNGPVRTSIQLGNQV